MTTKSQNANLLFFGCDHAGRGLKESLMVAVRANFPTLECVDLGCETDASVDYPDFARAVATRVAAGEGRGVLVCGSGIGMTISANKIAGIRAAQVWDVTSARLSREHNDANVICLGARLTGPEVANEALKIWLTTPFSGGRHERRIELISRLEKRT